MKISNNALYYIRHKITETKDKRYIELEDDDWSKFENIIRTFEKKSRELAWDLEEYKKRLIEWRVCPYRVLLELRSSFSYRKKATGRAKLNDAIEKSFLNLGELKVIDDLRRIVKDINRASEGYQSSTTFLDSGITDEEFREGKFSNYLPFNSGEVPNWKYLLSIDDEEDKEMWKSKGYVIPNGFPVVNKEEN